MVGVLFFFFLTACFQAITQNLCHFKILILMAELYPGITV